MKIKLQKLLLVLSMVNLFCMNSIMYAYASNTYAKNAAMWILDGVFWIVIVFALIGAGGCFMKRNVTGGVIIILLGAIICMFCKNPSLFTEIGNTLKSILGLGSSSGS